MTTTSSLFLRLYLDEDLSVLVADLVRAHGFDVLPTREAHNLGRSDHEQLAFATAHVRVVLTRNRIDFERLHTETRQSDRPHAGILLANRRASDFELARRILTVLDRFTADELRDQSLYLYAHFSGTRVRGKGCDRRRADATGVAWGHGVGLTLHRLPTSSQTQRRT